MGLNPAIIVPVNFESPVLIVDDEPLLVETIAFNLKKAGFSVLKAFDGESGLQQALKSKPQLVILDVMLPQISGWDVCRALRTSLVGQKHVPILMITARGEAGDHENSREAGADDHLLKPFSMQELTTRVQALLSRAEGGVDAQPLALKDEEQVPIPHSLKEKQLFCGPAANDKWL